MKLFVTGGAGFIGSCFVRTALTEGWAKQIVNFDKLTYAGNLENVAPVAEHPGYRFVHADICDAEAVEKAVRDDSAGRHCAFRRGISRRPQHSFTRAGDSDQLQRNVYAAWKRRGVSTSRASCMSRPMKCTAVSRRRMKPTRTIHCEPAVRTRRRRRVPICWRFPTTRPTK